MKSNLGRWLLFIMLFSGACFANQAYVGYCSNGGTKVVTAGLNSTTSVMASYPGCTVTVNNLGGGLATIFSDNLGTPLSNPFQASLITGQFTFYAANARYSITLSGGTPISFPSPVTITDVLLNDPAATSITQATVTANGFISSSANPSATGIFRAASSDSAYCFRNFANTNDICIKKTGAASANQPANMIDLTGFGAVEAASFETSTVAPAVGGVLACAASDNCVNIRNQTNTADIVAIAKDASDRVVVGGAAGLSTAAINDTGAATISGGLSTTTGVFSGSISGTGATFTSEVAPSITGVQLGDTAHRWDLFARNIDWSGTFTGAAIVATSISTTTLTVTGTSSLASVNNIKLVNAGTAGADWCAKVMTQDAALGATAGEIWIDQSAGTSACAVGITLSDSHVLRFVQGGTYALGTVNISPGNHSGVVCINEATIISYTGTGYAFDALTVTEPLLWNCQISLNASPAGGIRTRNASNTFETRAHIKAVVSASVRTASQVGALLQADGATSANYHGDYELQTRTLDIGVKLVSLVNNQGPNANTIKINCNGQSVCVQLMDGTDEIISGMILGGVSNPIAFNLCAAGNGGYGVANTVLGPFSSEQGAGSTTINIASAAGLSQGCGNSIAYGQTNDVTQVTDANATSTFSFLLNTQSGLRNPVRLNNGSAATPSLAQAAATSTGLFFSSGGILEVSTLGTAHVGFGTAGPRIGSGDGYCFSSTADPNGTTDTCIGRSSAGVITFDTTTPGNGLGKFSVTAPVINGTPTGTGIPTVTLKKGSGAGNYTSASTTYVVVDATNLCYTVTIPTGWKLMVNAAVTTGSLTAAVNVLVALTDNAACATANAGLLQESSVTPAAASVGMVSALTYVINGDGASHNVALQYKTTNGADSVFISNSTATLTPTITFLLTPSN